MNKFKNTYINTSNLSPSEINKLAKKYSEASGYPLESETLGDGGTGCKWESLTSVKHGEDNNSDPVDVITCTDDLRELLVDEEFLTEITEADLDNYLNGGVRQPLERRNTMKNYLLVKNSERGTLSKETYQLADKPCIGEHIACNLDIHGLICEGVCVVEKVVHTKHMTILYVSSGCGVHSILGKQSD